VPDFSAGVSQYLLINIKLHQKSDDSCLTSSEPLHMARGGGWEKAFSATRGVNGKSAVNHTRVYERAVMSERADLNRITTKQKLILISHEQSKFL
jgi:hypothetical protein